MNKENEKKRFHEQEDQECLNLGASLPQPRQQASICLDMGKLCIYWARGPGITSIKKAKFTTFDNAGKKAVGLGLSLFMGWAYSLE